MNRETEIPALRPDESAGSVRKLAVAATATTDPSIDAALDSGDGSREPDYKELFLIASELLDVYAKDYLRLKKEHDRVLKALSEVIADGAFLRELLQAGMTEVDS